MTDDSVRPDRDADGWTALDWAAGRGDVPEIRRLLEAGADPGGTVPDGRTAYQIALGAGHLAAARLLRAAEDAAGGSVADRSWRPYCRAYPLGDLRRFTGWQHLSADAERELPDSVVVFLHDDLTVTLTAWPGEDVLLAAGGAAWAAFCQEDLGFAVPDDFDVTPASSGEPVDSV
jgi:Ankyrin repeats (many copies)